MPKRVKIGDVIEIPTRKGFAYAQYTPPHPTHGGLIRVFEALFKNRPSKFSEVVSGPIRFSTFFPVATAVNRGVFNVVAHEQIAPENKPFPLFRNGIADPKTKKVSVWWFWDGQKEWRVGDSTPEYRKQTITTVWS